MVTAHVSSAEKYNSKLFSPGLRGSTGKDLQMSLGLDTHIQTRVFQLSWAVKPGSVSHTQRDHGALYALKFPVVSQEPGHP